jgi:predicted ATPase/class 3 adenylate cyclase
MEPPLEPINEIGMLIGSDLKQRFRQAGLESAGQRRTVTVLFADLCDYTGLSGKIDDESLYDVIQLYIHMLAEKVYQFEGMVDKITGDGIMALFGAPIAHENPAERAVRATLEMQAGLEKLNQDLEDRLGEKIQMHFGLNRGSVIVGGIGSDLLFDYTAIGDSVNLARRLQEAALPDTILVSESVYQTTQALFNYQELTDLDLKGYQQGKKGYQLLGVKSQPGLVRGIQGLRSPMVGRNAELDFICDGLADLTQNQLGQFVILIGEAGIGKSRLTAEFKTRVNPDQFTLLEGQSLTYRKSVSYWIFIELLRDYLGVTNSTNRFEVHERLITKVNLALGSESRNVLPFLEKLLSLEPSDPVVAQRLRYLEAEQLRQQTFIAVRNFLLAEAKQRPLILILEDLHWADEISLDLIAFLVESIDDKPVMVLGISRPTMEGKFEDLLDLTRQRFQERCRIIELQTLSDDQSDELLFGLLGIPDIPEQFRSQIFQRAAGVPFYIEEILRMLIDKQILVHERGQWLIAPDEDLTLEVPDNLQDLILTRFDRLNPIQRSVLQTASVIGREFNAVILNQAMGYGEDKELKQILSSLEEKAFIAPLPEQGFGGYLFRHVLTSDAVYKTLLRRDRNRLHGKVAQTLESVYADHLESQVEVLAGHYLRSVYLDKALHYLVLAGSKSAQEYANLQAKKYFEEARDLLADVEHSAEQAMKVWTGLGDVLVFIGEYAFAQECYKEAVKTGIASPEIPADLSPNVIQRKIAITYERQGDFDQALNHLSLANDALRASGNSSPVAKAQILNAKGWIFFLRGNFDQAQDALESALDLVEETDEFSTIASIHNRLGAVSYQLREYKQAANYVRKSLEMRKTLGDLSGEARLYNNLGLLGLMSGDLRDAEMNFDQSIALLEKIGDTEGITLANINLGLVKYDLGDYESAGVYLERARGVAEKIGHRFYLGLANMYLGRLETALKGYERAVGLLDESLQIFEELGAEDNLIDAMCYLAENYLAWGNLADSIQWSERAYSALTGDGAEQVGDSVQAGRVLRVQGAIARLQGNLEHADQFLLESAKIFSAALEKLESARTAYELGLLAMDLNETGRAQEYFNQAREIYTDVGAKMELQRVDTGLSKIAV